MISQLIKNIKLDELKAINCFIISITCCFLFLSVFLFNICLEHFLITMSNSKLNNPWAEALRWYDAEYMIQWMIFAQIMTIIGVRVSFVISKKILNSCS